MRLEGLVVGRGVERAARGEEELRHNGQYQQDRQTGEYSTHGSAPSDWLSHHGAACPHRAGTSSGLSTGRRNTLEGPSTCSWGRRRSTLRGSHQLLRPSKCMTAGTSSIRMMVASTRMAATMPTAKTFTKT